MARIDRVGNLHKEAGMDLDGRIALVTGVGKDSGIGLAVASALAGAGAHVIVTARTEAQADAMAGRIGQGAEAMVLDIADRAWTARSQRDAGPEPLSLQDKGFLLTSTEDIINWARTGRCTG
jgi:hypothetical protein